MAHENLTATIALELEPETISGEMMSATLAEYRLEPTAERALELTTTDSVSAVDDEENAEPAEQETAAEIALKNGVYHEIRRKLQERYGLPPREIAFIHEADTPARKAALFADVNAGRVRVLIGSTAKLGTGVNVQQRLVALHHVDQPWKPAELEQREGRILRQGNIYPEVFVFHYVTERSFDGYMLQTLEAKARFISQIMAGEVTARTAEDVGDMVLTVAQVKAIASGNPAVQRRIETEVKLVKLDRLRAAYYQQRAALRADITALPQHLAAQTALIAGHEHALQLRAPLAADAFHITLKTGLGRAESVVLDKRERAGARLRQLADLLTEQLRRGVGRGSLTETVGRYRGFGVSVQVAGNGRFSGLSSLFDYKAEILMQAEPGGVCYVAQLGESNVGVTQSMDYQLRHIETQLEQARSKLQTLHTRLVKAQEEVHRPWGQAAEYNRLRREYEALGEGLQAEGVALESNTVFAVEEAETEAHPLAAAAGHATPSATEELADTGSTLNPFNGLEDWPLTATETEAAAGELTPPVNALAQTGVLLFDARTDDENGPERGLSAKPDLPTVKPPVLPLLRGAAPPCLETISQPLFTPSPQPSRPPKMNRSPKPKPKPAADNHRDSTQGCFAWDA